MISPQILKAFCTEMEQRITSINFSEVVVDDSQLTLFLKAADSKKNQLFFGILPEYPLQGTENKIKWNNQMMFMVLQKTNSRDTKHSEFIQIMEETLATAREVVTLLLAEKSGDNGDFCSIMNEIVENSVRIYPIWGKAECNGYGIDFDLLTTV